MSEEFELKLKTSRVTADHSYATGDTYTCGNDEAWIMIDENQADLVGNKAPQKPQRIIDLEEKSKPQAKKGKKK